MYEAYDIFDENLSTELSIVRLKVYDAVMGERNQGAVTSRERSRWRSFRDDSNSSLRPLRVRRVLLHVRNECLARTCVESVVFSDGQLFKRVSWSAGARFNTIFFDACIRCPLSRVEYGVVRECEKDGPTTSHLLARQML